MAYSMGYNAPVLKSVTLKNFKLHTSSRIDTAPLTIFIGPNNSGESSVFLGVVAFAAGCATGQRNFTQPGT